MDACQYEPDELFLHQGVVFFGLAEFCDGECSEDIKVGFHFSIYVIGV